MGTLNQFVGWLFNNRKLNEQYESNQYRKLFSLKYYILFGLLVASIMGTLQIGLLDPISLLYRSFAVSILPAIDMALEVSYIHPHVHQFAWVVGYIFFIFLSLNFFIPRFFCRIICPLGAFFGILSGFSLWRVERDIDKCTDCNACLQRCEGASDPHLRLRKSECTVCLNCIDDCPHDALSFRGMPSIAHEITKPDLSRRKTVFAMATGLIFFPFARTSGYIDKNFKKEVIRPPGSIPETDFLRRCLKCDQCIRVCPTNVLQPAMLESGIEGLWTPIMKMKIGYCELNCTLCGQVCPTGAIQKIPISQKLGLGKFNDLGPIKTGTAFFDRGRCLPWAMDTPCVVCQEVCPTSPKAIYTREVEVINRSGKKIKLTRPFLDPSVCIGCGICEHECPVKDHRAIRVSSVGETRSEAHSMLLR
jgi:ferredoxin